MGMIVTMWLTLGVLRLIVVLLQKEKEINKVENK
jgi:hypothetical protein